MKSKVLWCLLLAGTFAVNPLLSNPACAGAGFVPTKAVKKNAQKATSKMQKTRGKSAIPNLTLLNDPNIPVAASPSKSNLLTHAEVCSLHVANNTDQVVYISVDNQPRMLVAGLGMASAPFAGSEHTIMGTAYQTDGSAATFGPVDVSNCNGSFDWDLAR